MTTGTWQDRVSDKVVDHPAARQKRRRTFQLSRSRLPLLVVGLLLLYVSISLGSRFDTLYTMQRDLQAVQAEVEELRVVNRDLSKQLDLLQSDAYVEQVAREKLGLVKPGETRIVPMADGAAAAPTASNAEVGD